MGVVAPLSQYDPMGQEVQYVDAVLAKLPGSHGVHKVALPAEYEPPKHTKLPSLDGQLYPAGQSVHAEEPAYEYVPLIQTVLSPLLQAYPDKQGVQVDNPSKE